MLLFLGVCGISSAQSLDVKRGIEEEKRKYLLPSQSYLSEKKEISLSDADFSQDAYFSELLSKKTAFLSDAYKVLIILMDMQDQFNDLDSQFNFLSEKRIIPKNIGLEPNYDSPLRRGDAACMFAKAMNIKGGIALRIFGLSRRYALKELAYLGIMFPGGVNNVMSGRELILTLTQAADYLAGE